MFDLKSQTTLSDFQEYLDNFKPIIADYNGKIIVHPIENQGILESEGRPNFATEYPREYTIILYFQNRNYLDAFLEDEERIIAAESWQTFSKNLIQYVAVEQPAQPGLPKFPLISPELLRDDPPARNEGALILLNAVQFKQEPQVPENINTFFGLAGPANIAAGTFFFSTLQKTENLIGDFPFDVLFLTEWASLEAYDLVHDTPELIDASQQYRNPSLLGFTEDQGRVTVELSID